MAATGSSRSNASASSPSPSQHTSAAALPGAGRRQAQRQHQSVHGQQQGMPPPPQANNNTRQQHSCTMPTTTSSRGGLEASSSAAPQDHNWPPPPPSSPHSRGHQPPTAQQHRLLPTTPHPHQWAAGDVIQQINASNAKIVATAIVIGFVAYHGILHSIYGIDSCTWLLSDGMYKGYEIWQPYGCMMHRYSELDVKRCFRYIGYWGSRNDFAFVGDSRIRQLYHEFLRQVHPESVPAGPTQAQVTRHSNLSFNNSQLRLSVDYLWQPMVNDSMLAVFQQWLTKPPTLVPSQPLLTTPKVIVVGAATWAIKELNASAAALQQYAANLTRIVKVLDRLVSSKSRVVWMLQEPVDSEKLHPNKSMITNDQIDLYNKAAMEVLQSTQVDVWSSSRLVAQGNLKESADGLHMGPQALSHDVQILLNMYCNDHMNFNDGTCCSSAEPVTTLQIVTFSTLGVCLVLAVGGWLRQWAQRMRRRRWRWNRSGQRDSRKDQPASSQSSDFQVLVSALARLAVIMAYFFICDRTNFFMKENKYFTALNFWLPIAYLFALGLFFTEDSKLTKVLHRDQTDEWKGWMQMVILVYHMTGASSVLPIYMHLRVLVSAYLFLTGYGHFYYFWQRGDAGLVRFFQRRVGRSWAAYWQSGNCGLRRLCEVLFRMNLMAVMLCLCMNRPYQFYYFVPLVSFWVLMVYLLLASPPQVTSATADQNSLHYLYLVLKFVALFSIVTILYMSEVFFEKVFVTRPWKALFVTTDDDIHEWWFRWKLDRYSVLFGMTFALLYLLAQRYGLLDDNNHGNLFSPGISLTAVLLSLIGIGLYTAFSFLCRNKPECNEVHPYLAFLPIVSYVILRNVSGSLRTRYSTFFSWFGRISLELFIGQYHVWLAADTHGALVLIPSYPVANVIVTSFVFVCIAHEVHRITGILVSYAVPLDWRLALRNLLLFLLVLVPIGVHDGMF